MMQSSRAKTHRLLNNSGGRTAGGTAAHGQSDDGTCTRKPGRFFDGEAAFLIGKQGLAEYVRSVVAHAVVGNGWGLSSSGCLK